MTLGETTTTGKDLRSRLFWLGTVMCLGLLVLVVRLYRIQITEGDEYAKKSVANFVRTVRVRAERGSIEDSRGTVLVDNRPSFDVSITPAFCENCQKDVLPKLSRLLGWTKDERAQVAQEVRQGAHQARFRPVPVQIDINRDALDRVSAHLIDLPGVEVDPVAHREYLEGPLLSHVLGYMNEITGPELSRLDAEGKNYQPGDYIGRRGIERAYEDVLRGKDGSRKEVVNARGRTIPGLNDLIQGDDRVAPKPGDDVVLSIDLRLQKAVDEIFPGKAGAVVVVDVNTGFIRAILSRPGFDPNVLTGRITQAELDALTQNPLQPMIFRPTQQRYSPGSTFKPITALAALESGKFTPNTEVNCPGYYRIGRRIAHCWRASGHGLQNVRNAIKHSCDVFFFHVGDVLGLDPIAHMAELLGFGHLTGIGVVPEIPGVMPTEAWHDAHDRYGYTPGMALNAAIGQGSVDVTPLQLAMAYATIANGGTLYKPQLVERIDGPDGHVVKQFQPEVVRRINFPPGALAAVVDGLTAVVNEPGGTGYWHRLKDIIFAGKTGTAQVRSVRRTARELKNASWWERPNAWFAAFAPAKNPEIAVVVLNEHAGEGASGSAPTAAAVIEKYFQLKKEDAEAAARAASTTTLARTGPASSGSAEGAR